MRASNEELQSANEELRSTLEELETSKEELQSMNEELQTVNQENRHKVEELAQLSSDLQNLLPPPTSRRCSSIASCGSCDSRRRSSDIFNVRMTDRGRPLSDLTHRLGYAELQEDAATSSPDPRSSAKSRTRTGAWYLTRVLPYRSTDDRIEGVVITFVDITPRKKAEEGILQLTKHSSNG